MISNDIYTPYFYIIQHKESKKLYAGARWVEGCHPDKFMKENEYQTSSKIIQKIISNEGLDIFDVVLIDSECDGIHPYKYETIFLEENDCAGSDNWYNVHNNKFDDISPMPFGSDLFKQTMIDLYGVDNCMKVSSIKQKQKDAERKTLLERYGVIHNMQIPGLAITSAKKRIEKWKTEGNGRSPLYGRTGDLCAGTGIKHNMTTEGSKVLSDNGKKRKNVPNPKVSAFQKEQGQFVLNNPMNDIEKRKLVGLSKIGKKAYINPSEPEKRKMFLPENAPSDWVLFTEYRKDLI